MEYHIEAEIKDIKYTPLMCDDLDVVNISELSEGLSKSSFFLDVDSNTRYAVSRWVSPKRTRSYPYARVYNTLQFSGNRVTIIPVYKDEGHHGDRDYLQWDTVSLMSLLRVYVIIGYYVDAEKNLRNLQKPKITNQKFDIPYLDEKIKELMSYQSGPLHWNLSQLENIGEPGERAIKSYANIANKLGVPLKSEFFAKRKINGLKESAELFKKSSRKAAKSAAKRETLVNHELEDISWDKATITITNFLGGEYYFTVDEVRFKDSETIQLVEAKNTTKKYLTSENDIKDALVKMILFTNLENIRIGGKIYQHESLIKFTSKRTFDSSQLSKTEIILYENLLEEAKKNNFTVVHT